MKTCDRCEKQARNLFQSAGIIKDNKTAPWRPIEVCKACHEELERSRAQRELARARAVMKSLGLESEPPEGS